MKIIEINPIARNFYVLIPLGILFTYVGVYSGISSGNFSIVSIIYLLIGLGFIIFIFEPQIIGVKRYVKIFNDKLIYKRTPISLTQEVPISEIEEVKFYGSKIYVKYGEKYLIINIDLIKMKSRIELRDFFVEEFKDKVIFVEQDNIFEERYKKRLKRIEEKQRQKNG